MADQFATLEEYEAAHPDDKVAPAAEAPAAPKFATVEAYEAAQSKTDLQRSYYTQAEKTPDRQAEILRLSEEQNLPPAFVERNFDDLTVKSRREGADFKDLATEYPASTEFLKDPANTALARDDVDNMKKTEGSVKAHMTVSTLITALMKSQQKVEREDRGSIMATWDWVTDAYASGMAGLIEGGLKIPAYLDTARKAINGESDQTLSSMVSGEKPKNPLLDNELLSTVKGVRKVYRDNVVEIDKSVSDEISKGNYAVAGKALVAQGLSNAHPQIVSLMLGMGVSKMAGAMLPGLTTAADTSAESLEKGASAKQAALNATLQGSIEVVAERLGTFGLLDHWEKSLTKTYSKQVSQEVLKEFFKPLVATALGEASEEAITSIAQDLSSYATGVDKDALKGSGQRALDAGLGGMFMGVVMGGSGAVAKAQARGQYLRQAEEAKQLYTALGAQTEESKVRERLPQKHSEFVKTVTKNGPVENIYVPVEEFQAYFQSKGESPAAFAAKIGATESFNEAAKTGGDLQVPLAQWTENVVGTEHYEHFADNMKFNPGDQTVKQAQAARSEAEAALKAVDAEATKDTTGDLVRGFEAQLRELGVQDPKQAKLLAGIGGLAQREGIDPAELFNELNISVGRGQSTEAGANVLNQDGSPVDMTPEARTARAEAMGFDTSRRVFHGGPAGITDFRTNGKGANKYLEGVYMTPSENEADRYAGMARRRADGSLGDTEIYSFHPPRDLLQLDDVVEVNDALKKMGLPTKVAGHKEGAFKYNPEMNNLGKLRLAVANEMRDNGEKATAKAVDERLKEKLQAAGYKGTETQNDGVINVFDPKHVRSTEAAFTDAESTNILKQEEGDDLRGQIRFGKKSIQIELFEKMDYSTFIHETGHLYLEVLNRLAAREGASEQTKADAAAILKWLDVKSFGGIKTEHHEKFADGFMNFVAEGKAPTKELRGVFRRFKLWVLSVANKLQVNGVNLTSEVRDVMSRMLVAEQEVSKASARMEYGPLFDAPAAAGMNENQAMKYRKAQQEARDAAIAEVNSGLMKELKKKQSVEQKAAREVTQKEVEQEVQESKAFRALSILQKNTLPDGTPLPENQEPLKIGRMYLEDVLSPEVISQLPRGITAKDGLNPEIAASVLGFPDGQMLLETLAATPKQSEFVEAETDRRMAEQFPDLLTDPVLPDYAVEKLHNDKRADLLEMELEHLASNKMPQLKDAIRRVARRPPRLADVRSEAETMIAAKPLSQIKPHLYSRAEVKAAKEAGQLLAKGDIDGAFLAKRKELLNHELFRAATEAKGKVEKAMERFKDIAAQSDEKISKTRDTDIVNAAKAVISQFWVAPLVDKTPDQYLEQLKKYDPETYSVVKTLVDSAMAYEGDAQNLSFDDFMDVSDSVEALWSLAKSSKQIEIDGKKVDREQVAKELNEKLVEYGGEGKGKLGYDKKVTEKEKAEIKLLGARAALMRTEHWCDTVDVESNGPFRQYIFEPISKATTEYRLVKGEVLKNYKAILDEWAKTLPREAQDKIVSSELGYTFENKTELIGALLHTGNASNLSKLLRGRAWGEIEDDGVVNTRRWDSFIERMIEQGKLTKEDYDFVQKVWDLMDTLKPGAQKAHKSIYGFYFNEITANEFTNKFGTYRGGYVPAKVDQYASEDAKTRKDREAFEQNNNSFQFPTTGRGFSKSRVDAYAAPLSLDVGLVGGHIDAVLRFTHIEPRVKEVARVVNDESFRSHMAEFLDPVAASEMLIPWLQRAATQKVVLPSEDGLGKILDPIARFLRKNVAMQFMVGNVTNAMQQVTGVVVAASKVKPKYLRNALVTYTTSIKATSERVVEKSAFMKSTQGSNIYETQQAIEQILVNPSWLENAQDFASKHTYFLQSATQNMVNTIVWTAAYDQSIEQGNKDEQAIKDADRAVRLTQGTNNPEDISRFEVGTATKRLFTQFAGYFNMLANLNGGELMKISRDVGLRKGAGRAFYLYTTAFALPAILSEILVRVMAGEPPDQDDDDSYLDDALSVFFGSQFNTLTAMIPWGGQVANTALKRFNEKQYDDRLSLSPVVSTIESMAGLPAEVYKAITDGTNNQKKIVKDVLFLMGVATSLPVGPVGKPVGYLIDVNDGKADPTGPIDFTRGLVTGKKGKQ